MSQEKVNKYKEEKANRRKNMAKAKRKRAAAYAVAILIVILIAAWIVYSAVSSITRNQAAKQTPVNLDAVSDYLMELNGSGEDAEDASGDENSDSKEDADSGEEGSDSKEDADSGDDAENN